MKRLLKTLFANAFVSIRVVAWIDRGQPQARVFTDESAAATEFARRERDADAATLLVFSVSLGDLL